jgi:hypothetical protein
MNNKLLALEAKKRLEVESERETLSTRKQQTRWKKERDSARELRREALLSMPLLFTSLIN